METGAVRIFCSNKDAETTTSSPNKKDSYKTILLFRSSSDFISIFLVSYPIPDIVMEIGKLNVVLIVKFPSRSVTEPTDLFSDKNTFIPTRDSSDSSTIFPFIIDWEKRLLRHKILNSSINNDLIIFFW